MHNIRRLPMMICNCKHNLLSANDLAQIYAEAFVIKTCFISLQLTQTNPIKIEVKDKRLCIQAKQKSKKNVESKTEYIFS